MTPQRPLLAQADMRSRYLMSAFDPPNPRSSRRRLISRQGWPAPDGDAAQMVALRVKPPTVQEAEQDLLPDDDLPAETHHRFAPDGKPTFFGHYWPVSYTHLTLPTTPYV